MKKVLPADVEVILLTLCQPYHFGEVFRLWRLLRTHQVDILHSHMFYASLFASPTGRLGGAPVVVETPHVREQWRKGKWHRNFTIDRAAGHCVHYYIAVSEANARYLTDEKGLPQDKIIVIENGSDLSRFRPDRPAPPGLRESLGFLNSDPVVLMLARLEEQKGHRILLDAVPNVLAEFPDCRLVLAGDGRLRRELELQAAGLNITSRLRFVGYQDNAPDWLALCDFTVLPSLYEGLPLAAIESLAAGKPVVASNVDGVPEVVVHEKNGLIVPPNDPDALAKAIRRLLREPALLKSFARHGRDWVMKRFQIQRQVQATQDLYIDAWNRNVAAESPKAWLSNSNKAG